MTLIPGQRDARQLETPIPISTVRYQPLLGTLDHARPDIYSARFWRVVYGKPVNPMSHLDVDEYCRYAMPLHWMAVVRHVFKSPLALLVSIALSWALTTVGIGAWPVLLVLWTATVAHQGCLLWKILGWRASSIILTNRRLVCPTGLLTRDVASTYLWRITNSSYRQTLLGQWLGYGTLRIESGGLHTDGSERELIPYVIAPAELHRMLLAPQMNAA